MMSYNRYLKENFNSPRQSSRRRNMKGVGELVIEDAVVEAPMLSELHRGVGHNINDAYG